MDDGREQRGEKTGSLLEGSVDLSSRKLKHRPDPRVRRVGVRQLRRRLSAMLWMRFLGGRT